MIERKTERRRMEREKERDTIKRKQETTLTDNFCEIRGAEHIVREGKKAYSHVSATRHEKKTRSIHPTTASGFWVLVVWLRV